MGLSIGQRHILREYWAALRHAPQIVRRQAFRRRTLDEELQEALLRGSLRKAFNGFDLLCLGLGIVIGTGWGLLSGVAAEMYAGPAVILSYLFAGLATLLTAACFAELCLEYPISGGAFSYIMVTFGELTAFVALGGLLLEYALGMAVAARGFSRYLARLCNQEASLFVVEVGTEGQHSFDFMAAGIIIIMTLILSLGVRQSAMFISGMTVLKFLLIMIVCIVGYTQATFSDLYQTASASSAPGASSAPTLVYRGTNTSAYEHDSTADPFLVQKIKGPVDPFFHPSYGGDGVFLAAAMLFFTYVGYGAICNAAEEARNVAHLPLALMGTAMTSTILYTMLAISLVLMTRPNVIGADLPDSPPEDAELSFITVFRFQAKPAWMQYVTCVALLLGILTTLTVGLFSVARIVMAASRDWLLPPFLARVSRRTQTPLVAQIVLGLIIAVLSMLVNVETATDMVSLGTLVVLWLVCNAQMYRRYFPDTQMRFTRYGTVEIADKQLGSRALGRHLSLQARKLLVWVHMVGINAISLALAVYYAETTKIREEGSDDFLAHTGLGCLWFVLCWLLVTLSLQVWCPLEYQPAGWHVPWWLMPWLPSAAILLVFFNVGALPNGAYWKNATFFGVLLAFYLLFSLPMSYIKRTHVDYVNTGELTVVEMSLSDGRWQPQQLRSMQLSGSMPQRLSTIHSSGQWKSGSWKGSATDSRGGGAGSNVTRSAPTPSSNAWLAALPSGGRSSAPCRAGPAAHAPAKEAEEGEPAA